MRNCAEGRLRSSGEPFDETPAMASGKGDVFYCKCGCWGKAPVDRLCRWQQADVDASEELWGVQSLGGSIELDGCSSGEMEALKTKKYNKFERIFLDGELVLGRSVLTLGKH